MLRSVSALATANRQLRLIKNLSATATAPALPVKSGRWDLYASVLVERLPVVSRSFNELEREFQEQLWRVEFENSLKSDHELKHEQDIRQAELIKKGQAEVDLDDTASKQTAQDLKDAYTEELKVFEFAPRTTADDAANNTSSTNRRLEDTLYLLLEQKLGSQEHFLLPQGLRQDGETMRQAAERVLREKCGAQLQVSFYGNAPCGFYKYKYPSNLRQEIIGAKVFFYRAALRQGNVDSALAQKYEWLEKTSLEGKLKNAAYVESVQKFLL